MDRPAGPSPAWPDSHPGRGAGGCGDRPNGEHPQPSHPDGTHRGQLGQPGWIRKPGQRLTRIEPTTNTSDSSATTTSGADPRGPIEDGRQDDADQVLDSKNDDLWRPPVRWVEASVLDGLSPVVIVPVMIEGIGGSPKVSITVRGVLHRIQPSLTMKNAIFSGRAWRTKTWSALRSLGVTDVVQATVFHAEDMDRREADLRHALTRALFIANYLAESGCRRRVRISEAGGHQGSSCQISAGVGRSGSALEEVLDLIPHDSSDLENLDGLVVVEPKPSGIDRTEGYTESGADDWQRFSTSGRRSTWRPYPAKMMTLMRCVRILSAPRV